MDPIRSGQTWPRWRIWSFTARVAALCRVLQQRGSGAWEGLDLTGDGCPLNVYGRQKHRTRAGTPDGRGSGFGATASRAKPRLCDHRPWTVREPPEPGYWGVGLGMPIHGRCRDVVVFRAPRDWQRFGPLIDALSRLRSASLDDAPGLFVCHLWMIDPSTIPSMAESFGAHEEDVRMSRDVIMDRWEMLDSAWVSTGIPTGQSTATPWLVAFPTSLLVTSSTLLLVMSVRGRRGRAGVARRTRERTTSRLRQ
jgi:hypothetical protein